MLSFLGGTNPRKNSISGADQAGRPQTGRFAQWQRCNRQAGRGGGRRERLRTPDSYHRPRTHPRSHRYEHQQQEEATETIEEGKTLTAAILAVRIYTYFFLNKRHHMIVSPGWMGFIYF